MTDSMRERKKRYVERAMEYLDSEYFCIGDNQMERISEICAELGIAVPDAKSIEFRYYLYGGGTPPDLRMMMRVECCPDTYYPVSDTMLDEAFFYYSQLIPSKMIGAVLKYKTRTVLDDLMKTFENERISYELDTF